MTIREKMNRIYVYIYDAVARAEADTNVITFLKAYIVTVTYRQRILDISKSSQLQLRKG